MARIAYIRPDTAIILGSREYPFGHVTASFLYKGSFYPNPWENLQIWSQVNLDRDPEPDGSLDLYAVDLACDAYKPNLYKIESIAKTMRTVNNRLARIREQVSRNEPGHVLFARWIQATNPVNVQYQAGRNPDSTVIWEEIFTTHVDKISQIVLDIIELMRK